MTELQQILLEAQKHYPKMGLSDHIKLIYQNEFGCAHLALQASPEQLAAECASASPGRNLFEPIGNGYRRLYLRNAANLGASVQTLHRICLATARQSSGRQDSLRRKLLQLYDLCRVGKLPHKPGLCWLYLQNYEAAGFPAVHHTSAYRSAYAPAYRVVSNTYARFFELLLRIDRMLATETGPILVAIDGPCASGKTTLAALLQTCYDCSVFHTDDFFLRPDQKTPERLREAGGNMDRERLEAEVLRPLSAGQEVCSVFHTDDFFLRPDQKTPERLREAGGNMDRERLEAEVLRPLSAGQEVLYRPYSCQTGIISSGSSVPFRQLNLIEGSYALHPALRNYYQIKVVLDITPEHQWSRLKRRESQKSLELFRDRWIPMEQAYAAATDLFSCTDLIYAC